MANEEKSRDAFQPKKRYAAVGMQQGRVMLDDDFNENERMRLEEERRVNLDVIGPAGSPDAGFSVSNGSAANGELDFDIAAGTFYLGGLRLWNPAKATYQLQDDWLQQGPLDRVAAPDGRVDLVYIEAWQQPVTATEDTELFEVALGGPDTSTRLRTMWRVHLATGVDGSDCAGAWTTLTGQWANAGLGTIDATGERIVDASLKVGYFQGQVGDLCTPAIAGGYLGAENQTIRVQLVSKTTFTWGLDNGAPLYQANVINQDTIVLSTDPRDQVHWPVSGQVIEILPPGARLPNKEKLADEGGFLTRVKKSFDPVTHSFTVDPPVPLHFGEIWQHRTDAGDLHGAELFVRVWDRGDDRSSPTALAIAPSQKLGDTGIDVTITGTALLPGDHWIISARPKTPQTFVPWDLSDGRAPQGTRRWFAPLALIKWHGDGTFDVLHDCRPSFPPLTRIRGCCTHTVGNGVDSFGQYTSIQAAINALPDEGGKVCVLAGTYHENIVIDGRKNITIEGCGRRTIIEPPKPDPGFEITESTGIKLVDLEIDHVLGIAVSAVDQGNAPGDEVANLELRGLAITARDDSAIYVRNAAHVEIVECAVTVRSIVISLGQSGDIGRRAAVFASGDDLLLERNEVTTADSRLYSHSPFGGIQIGGNSSKVEIRRNRVTGGSGNAITLGSVAYAPVIIYEKLDTVGWAGLQKEQLNVPAGHWIVITDQGCVGIVWDPPPPGGGDNPPVPFSEGDVEDVRIIDNDLTGAAFSGIAVARFFDEDNLQFITTDRLVIENNRIIGNLQAANVEIDDFMLDSAAFGAIALADGADIWIRDNIIERNGPSHLDPICGIFALRAEAISIENNRIMDNGPLTRATSAAKAGMRGGIVLPRVTTPTMFVPGTIDMRTQRRGYPSLRIHDNIVSVWVGRAIYVIGDGEMSVSRNQLSSHGVVAPVLGVNGFTNKVADVGLAKSSLLSYAVGSTTGTNKWTTAGMWNASKTGAVLGTTLLSGTDLLGAATVLIINLGTATNLVQPRQRIAPDRLTIQKRSRLTGKLLFSSNQVVLDLAGGQELETLCSVLLMSLDDVGMTDNQLEVLSTANPVVIDAIVIATTARANDNRIDEEVETLTGSRLSLAVFGVAAQATSNVTTLCIAVVASVAALRVEANNIEIGPNNNRELCNAAQRVAVAIGDKLWQLLQAM